MEVSVLRCPSCGAPAGDDTRTCQFCGSLLVPDSIGLGLLRIDKAGAERLFQETLARLKTHPDDAAAHCRLGVCYLKRAQYEEAIAEFSRAGGLAPQAWGVFYLEAFAVALGRNWLNPRVAERAKHALGLNPRMKEAQSLLHIYNGVEIMETNTLHPDYEDALAELREALALGVEEQKPYIYYYSGVALDEGGDTDDAIKMYQQACQLGYVDSKILTRLGVLLAQTGQSQLAIWELEKAAQLDPTNHTVKELLESLKAQRAANPQGPR